MITPARGGEGFFELQRDDGREKRAPPRSGLVQLLIILRTARDITLTSNLLPTHATIR